MPLGPYLWHQHFSQCAIYSTVYQVLTTVNMYILHIMILWIVTVLITCYRTNCTGKLESSIHMRTCVALTQFSQSPCCRRRGPCITMISIHPDEINVIKSRFGKIQLMLYLLRAHHIKMQFSNSHYGHGLFDLLIVTFQGQTFLTEYAP